MTRLFQWTVIVASVTVALSTSAAQVAAEGRNIVETAVNAGSFKTLAAALQAADLVDALQGKGPFTVFAPTDEAFSKLPEGTVETLLQPENKQQLVAVLTYHVVSGELPAERVVKLSGAKTLNGQRVDIKVENGQVRVDQAQVVKTDIQCTNGVIHVIDQVILPAFDDIPTTAVKAGQFNTLVAAAKAAGLVEALSGEGPYTVFAPTDDAFAKLPKDTVKMLLEPENKSKLASILKYHVVEGRVYSTDALEAGRAKTLQGNSVRFSANGGRAKINDANLVATDLDASNGVIHVIDSVILPPEEQSGADPRQMIETAIAKGAPLYNSGHPNQCAQIYMTTAQNLLVMENHGLCSSTTHMLQAALDESQQSDCGKTQAWTMRHALDVAYRNVR